MNDILIVLKKQAGLSSRDKTQMDQLARVRILEVFAGEARFKGPQGPWSRKSPISKGLAMAQEHFALKGMEVDPAWFSKTDQKVFEGYLRGAGKIRAKSDAIQDQEDVENVAIATMIEPDPFGSIGKYLKELDLSTARKWAATQGVQRAVDYVREEIKSRTPGRDLVVGPGGLSPVQQSGDSPSEKGREVKAPGVAEFGDPSKFIPALLDSPLGAALKKWLLKLWSNKLTPSTMAVAEAWLEDPGGTNRGLAAVTNTSVGSVIRFRNYTLPDLLKLSVKAIDEGKAPKEVVDLSNLIERNQRFMFASEQVRFRVQVRVASTHLCRVALQGLLYQEAERRFRESLV